MAAESKKAVIAAIIGNAAIAVIKFVAGSMTGSSAMISEGIHSLVDTGNGGLLFHGLRRGARPADEHHPFGHGMEVYFWSLIVAVSIFGIGGGMSIYEGIIHIQHPAPLENPDHQLHRPGAGRWSSRASRSASPGGSSARPRDRGARSPPSITARTRACSPCCSRTPRRCWASWSPSSACSSSHQLEQPVLDGLASVVIGGILIVAALWLAYESRSLLVGEAADPELVAAIREIALADPAVIGLGVVLTMHLGPDDVLLNIEVQFTAGAAGRGDPRRRAPHRGAHHRAVPRGEPDLHRGRGAARRRCGGAAS